MADYKPSGFSNPLQKANPLKRPPNLRKTLDQVATPERQRTLARRLMLHATERVLTAERHKLDEMKDKFRKKRKLLRKHFMAKPRTKKAKDEIVITPAEFKWQMKLSKIQDVLDDLKIDINDQRDHIAFCQRMVPKAQEFLVRRLWAELKQIEVKTDGNILPDAIMGLFLASLSEVQNEHITKNTTGNAGVLDITDGDYCDVDPSTP